MIEKCAVCGNEFEKITNQLCCSSDCKKERRASLDRQYYLNNKERIEEYKKNWARENQSRLKRTYRKHYENNKEKIIKRAANWKRNNPDKVKKAAKKYRENNKNKISEINKDYRERVKHNEDYKLKVRIRTNRRYHRIKKANGSYTDKDIKRIMKQQKNKCYWCKKKLDQYHIDHIIPISKGGNNTSGNICVSCPECNTSKGAKMPSEFIGRLF